MGCWSVCQTLLSHAHNSPFSSLGRVEEGDDDHLDCQAWMVVDDDDDDLYIIGADCLSAKVIISVFKGFGCFFMFIDTFPFSKVSGNRRNDQIP